MRERRQGSIFRNMNTTIRAISGISHALFRVLPAMLVVLSPLLAGCAALEEKRKAEQMDRNEVRNLRIEADALKNSVKGLEAANVKLVSDMDVLKTDTAKEAAEVRNQLVQLERTVKAMQAAAEEDKKEFEERVVKTIHEIMNKQYQSSSRGKTSAAAGGGNEHVVEAGETLSQIARTYGVTVEAIMKANNLSDAKIRTGQKLVIPK